MLKLYHFSNTKHKKLVPQIGSRRHEGEDDQAKDVPVVWLTPDPNSRLTIDNQIPKYRHEVSVKEDDPNLKVDQKLDDLTSKFNAFFNKKNSIQFYHYHNEILIDNVTEWDEEKGDYL